MGTPAQGPAVEPGQLHPVLNVFFSPAAVMDSLARQPRFLPALIVMTVISIGANTVAFQKGVIERGIRTKMESNPRLEQLPAEQRERIIEQYSRISSYVVLGGAAAGPAIGLLLGSGVFLLLTNGLLGTPVRFRQMLAAVAHGWLPMSLYSLIAIPIVLAKEPEVVDFQNLAPLSNLSFLFSPTEQHRLYMIGSSIDLFSLWVIALITVGIARLTGKSKGKVLAVVLAPWALYVGIFKVLLG